MIRFVYVRYLYCERRGLEIYVLKIFLEQRFAGGAADAPDVTNDCQTILSSLSSYAKHLVIVFLSSNGNMKYKIKIFCTDLKSIFIDFIRNGSAINGSSYLTNSYILEMFIFFFYSTKFSRLITIFYMLI